ncbi:MAG: fibronectin type III domain-containing protein, partial [Dehalococcoidia bacterium]|nr:fibronectin type III domain-containing protein [Dehalococcoidia bacterium]
SVTFHTQSVIDGTATVEITFGPDESVPSTPGSLVATPVNYQTISLTWAPSNDNVGVAGYNIFRAVAPATPVQVETATSASYTDTTGLTQETTYTYQVQAYDSAGNVSGLSNTASATTPILDTEAPSVPGLSATPKFGSPAKTTLSWTPSSDNVGVVSYTIYRNGAAVITVSGTTTSYTDRLKKGTNTYYVRAFDAAGNFAQSSSVSVQN